MSSGSTIRKFLRAQGGIGPDCLPGPPGEAQKLACIKKAVLEYNRRINVDYDKATSNIPYELAEAYGLLGSEFEDRELDTFHYPSLVPAFYQMFKAEESFRRGYNDNYSSNVSEVPRFVASAAAVEKQRARSDAISSFRFSEGIGASKFSLLRQCFCTEAFQKKVLRAQSGDIEDKADPDSTDTDDGVQGQLSPEISGSESNKPSSTPARTISRLGVSIPKVFRQYRVLANLIEIRSDNDLIFSICQMDDNLSVRNIWFGENLVYNNGVPINSDFLSSVEVNSGNYKDLFTVELVNSNSTDSTLLNEILFKNSGEVWVEAVQNQNITETSELLVSSSVTQLSEDFTVVNNKTVVDNYPNNLQLPFTMSTDSTCKSSRIYSGKQLVNPFSASSSPILISTAGVVGESLEDNPTHAITKTAVTDLVNSESFGISGLNSVIYFSGNIGIDSNFLNLLTVDVVTKNITTTPISGPVVGFNVDNISYSKDTSYICLIDYNTIPGDTRLHVIKNSGLDSYDLSLGVEILPLLPTTQPYNALGPIISNSGNLLAVTVEGEAVQIDIDTGSVTTFSTPAIDTVNLTSASVRFVDQDIRIFAFYNPDLRIIDFSSVALDGSLQDIFSYLTDDIWTLQSAENYIGYLAIGKDSHYELGKLAFQSYGLFLQNLGSTGRLFTKPNVSIKEMGFTNSNSNRIQSDLDLQSVSEDPPVAILSYTNTDYEDQEIERVSKVDLRVDSKAILSDASAQDILTTIVTYYDDYQSTERSSGSLIFNYIDIVPNSSTTDEVIFDTDSMSMQVSWRNNNYSGVGANYTRANFVDETPIFTPEIDPVEQDFTTPSSIELPPFLSKFPITEATISPGIKSVSTHGTTQTDLNTVVDRGGPHMGMVEGEVIVVQITDSSVSLNSSDYLSLIENPYENLICIAGQEWVQYQIANEVSTGVYVLSGLLRGRFFSFYNASEVSLKAGASVFVYAANRIILNYTPTFKSKPAIALISGQFSHNFADEQNFLIPDSRRKLYAEMSNYGFTDVDTAINNRYYHSQTRTYNQIEYIESFRQHFQFLDAVQDTAKNSYPLPDIDDQHTNYFLEKGFIDNDLYCLRFKKYRSTTIPWNSLGNPSFIRYSVYVNGIFEYSELIDPRSSSSRTFQVNPLYNPLTEELSVILETS